MEKPIRDRTRKAAQGRAARAKPLRARYGSRRTAPARKEAPAVPGGAAAADDTVITALELEAAPLSPAMAAYFEKCREKLGFVPNVLKAYAFDMPKLEAFVAMYNDLMLAPSGLSKLEREMIAVAVSSHNRCYYCLVAHGAAVRQLSGISPCRPARTVPACSIKRRAARWCSVSSRPSKAMLPPAGPAGIGQVSAIGPAASRGKTPAVSGSPATR